MKATAKGTERDFSRGSIGRHILHIAAPMTLAQLINVLYNIVDRVYIGLLSEDATNALTGLGVAFPVCTIVIAFANLVGSGGAPLFSIQRGAGDEEEAGRILDTSFALLVGLGLVLSAVGLAVREPLLYLLGASEATFGYADAYLSVYLLGTVFVMLSLGLNAFINAQGFSGVGMLTVTIGAVCNLILDPIFIFRLEMGVQGAALATVISQGLSALWTFVFLTGKRTLIRLHPDVRRLWRERGSGLPERVGRILSLGLSGFIMSVTNSAVQIVANVNLSWYGGDLYIAAMTIINSVREVVQMVTFGISNGAQPIISYNYGAGQYDRVRTAIRITGVALLIYTAAAWLAVMAFAPQMVRVFNRDEALLPVAVQSMHLYFFGYVMMAFQFTGQCVFQALGRSRQAVFFSLLRKVFIVIPLTFLLPLIAGLGADGVFLAEPVSNFVGGLACFLTMYFTVYRRLGRAGNGVAHGKGS
ncbi:MAG: MATE family efflux transporter [Clostridiales bacterium]|nr:MATE family efflux transporter [Clostridiales bacterium]